MAKKSIKFNAIFIIQSLKQGERATGDEISHQIKLACFKRGIEPMDELINVESREEFFEVIDHITESIKYGVHPYIHFEMHGSFEGGLGLSNDEHIPWKELKEPIRKMNIACGNNLYISLATCHGANFLDMYKGEFDKPCPFYGYIGATEEVNAIDFEVSFTLFFQALLTEDSITSGIKALVTALPINKGNYIFIDCEDYNKELRKTWNTEYGSLAGKNKYFKYLVGLAKERYPHIRMTKERKKELERFVYGKYMDEYFIESKKVFLHQKPYIESARLLDFLNK